jgi:DNA modification methylase
VNRLICGNHFDVLPTLGRFKCLIADPPDNIGLGYSKYKDRMKPENYRRFLHTSFRLFLEHADIVWVSYNAKWTFMVGSIVEDLLLDFPEYEAKAFIQTFTFGQNRKTDCGNGHRPIVRFKHKKAKLYPKAIRVPSWRQLNGDKRAAKGGMVPLDVWSEFPRITGNCKERRAWHPTQLREALVKRMVDFSTLPGEPVADIFSGTGTVLRAVTDRPITSVELDSGYCRRIAREHGLKVKKFARAAA